MDSSVIDLFYEAAVIPEFWPQACSALAKEVNASTATIFSFNAKGAGNFVCTPNIREGIEKFMADPRAPENIRPARALVYAPSTFTREIDVLSEEEFKNDFVLKEHIRPAGMYWSAGCAFQEPSGDTVVVDLLRREGMDHYSDRDLVHLNGLKADLSRSIFLTSKLAFSTARSITHSMSLLKLASAVVRENGQVLAANPEFQALAPRLSIGARDRLSIAAPGPQALLSDAISKIRSALPAYVQSIPVPARFDLPPLIIHVIPVKGAARDIFTSALALVLVTSIGEVGAPEARVLSGLFDLTPAEARVARLFAMGRALDAISNELGIGLETVRSHIKKAMQKTGTHRQAELMGLLLGLTSPISQLADP